jgi:N-acetylmuramoyl-L-alanine amidase
MRRAALLVFLLLGAFTGAPAFAAETVSVVVAGEPLEPIPSYRAGNEMYLDAKRVGQIYGGQVYWYPVSGRVQLSLRGRTIQFVVDSNKAAAGDAVFSLAAPVLLRMSHAFLPVSLLHMEDFERWSGFDARFDAATKTLQVERRTTAGPLHAFSYKGRTRIALELASGLSAQATARGVGGLEVTVPGAVVESDDKVDLDDGIVSSYAVKQEPRQVRITVRLAEKGQKWRTSELPDPRRFVVDVYALGVEPAAETPAATPETAAAAPSSGPEPPVSVSSKSVAVSTPAPAAVKRPAAAPAAAPAKPKKRIIVVDAGHGGKDPGATGTRGTKEKDINLAAALELARVLRERGDFEVILTRTDDTFIPLSDRSKIANDAAAALFVSLHCNSAFRKREHGFEVYSVSETASDPEAEQLAEAENAAMALEGKKPEDETAKQILLAMTKTEMINESAPFAALVERAVGKRIDVPDRGQKQAGFYVLRGTHAPAILVEMAFVSNVKDEAQLGSRRFRRRMAEGVAAGIADYARKRGWLE